MNVCTFDRKELQRFPELLHCEAKSANVAHQTLPEMEAETIIFHSISRQLGSKMLAGHLTAGQTITPIP